MRQIINGWYRNWNLKYICTCCHETFGAPKARRRHVSLSTKAAGHAMATTPISKEVANKTPNISENKICCWMWVFMSLVSSWDQVGSCCRYLFFLRLKTDMTMDDIQDTAVNLRHGSMSLERAWFKWHCTTTALTSGFEDLMWNGETYAWLETSIYHRLGNPDSPHTSDPELYT